MNGAQRMFFALLFDGGYIFSFLSCGNSRQILTGRSCGPLFGLAVTVLGNIV